MIPCSGCHRHVRTDALACPFCAVPLAVTPAPTSARISSVALAAGLMLLACKPEPDDAGETTATTGTDTDTTTSESGTTTDPTTTESGTTLGDGDGDTETDTESSGADYGGPPVCPEAVEALPLTFGSNAVDITDASNTFTSSCGSLDGTGPDQVYQFVAPSTGTYVFTLLSNGLDGWLLEFSEYDCFPILSDECMPQQDLIIPMSEGEILLINLDSSAGGTGSIEINQG
ncbi:hypothetical protein DB30_07200 [Enhygromyxa salina]|uniref:Uncharacterized protein n=1 Tax=Enhygromyxa salina TaxID=215803 RepID=A0A0C1ZN23_9BACT|nr:hypothetical protein [Enhygromyxa salina]KIG18864.1 hypothetical protein DB30_07200 [Enhygromyxa salina]